MKAYKDYKAGKIDLEGFLSKLTVIGDAPCLLYDDNGHWALTFDGMQNIAPQIEAIDTAMTCFVEAHQWKDTIRDAVIAAMEDQ